MLKIYIYFLISITIHEISHIIIAKIYRVNLKNLRVSLFGASIEMEKCFRHKSVLKILIYLAGPISNLIFALVIYYSKFNNTEKIKIIYTNLSLFIFNLFPIIPLDGGNILREILKIKRSNYKASEISLLVSKFNLSLLTFVYSIVILKIKNIFFLVLIIYLWYLNFIEEKKIELVKRTYIAINKNLKYLKQNGDLLEKI